ncbi:MAG TPA: proteasome subunit alpha [Actinocrinis sp.]|nr:proteasome subunit alpha [Actinocrinis sp.]
MSTPFYVSPEQLMKDRADYARKGIARGRSVAVLAYDDGILLVGENPSRALHKISEVYDRIAFAAAGKYNEYENLRQAGVRVADTRGYLYDRRDVSGRGLANVYAQTLGTIFSEASKPYEVELIIAEVGDRPEDDQIYRLTYDGSVADAQDFVVMGGPAEAVSTVLKRTYVAGATLGEVLRVAVDALGRDGTEPRTIAPNQLEVAVLDRNRKQERKFRRVTGAQLARLLSDEPGAGDELGENGNGEGPEASAEPAGSAEAPDTTAAPTAAADPDTDVIDLIDEVLDEEGGQDGSTAQE